MIINFYFNPINSSNFTGSTVNYSSNWNHYFNSADSAPSAKYLKFNLIARGEATNLYSLKIEIDFNTLKTFISFDSFKAKRFMH